jgi:hypothetical protein
MNTACLKDEETGQNWGNGGKTAKMIARHRCSDNGFYNADIQDCGGWRFRAWCHGATPNDWSTPYSDEGARARGRGDRNNEALIQCKEKGYAGINPNSWRDKGEWAFSLQCVNPGWIGDWNESDGCQSDGQTRWYRKVDARGLDWNVAADWLINNNEVKQHNFSKAWKEQNAGGMFVVALRDDKKCFVYNQGTNDDGCEKPGKRKQAKQCNNWPNGWTASQDVVNACKKNAPAGSNVAQKGVGVWAFWSKDDSSCNPGWIGEWNNSDGCQADGQTRWFRKVDAKGGSWEDAADWLIGNDTKQHNFSKAWKEKKADGMYVVALRDDKSCFIYNNQVNNDGCEKPGKRKQAKQCNNWPNGWTASQDVVNACKKNAPAGSNVAQKGVGVWAFWSKDDSSCNPGWIGEWNNSDGCQADGQTRWFRKVDAKGGSWEDAADWLIGNDTKQHNFSKAWKEKKADGMYVVALRDDKSCFIYNNQVNNDGCEKPGKRKQAKQCNNWPNGWVASQDVVNACKKNAPAGSEPRINGAQVWSHWTIDDTSCNPSWIGEWNSSDGCQADGQTRWFRKVDAKGGSWEDAADWLIGNNEVKQHNFSKAWREKKADGMYVVALRDDKSCFIYNKQVNDDGCEKPGKRKQAKQCNNWPNGWVASQDVVNACKKNAPAGSEPKINGTQVWSHWTIDDTSCNPTPKNGWFSPGCDGDGIRHYWTQVDAKGGSWELAAEWLAGQYKVGQSYNFGRGNQEVTKVEWRKDTTGSFVDIRTKDVTCNTPYFEQEQTITDSEGLQMKYRKCSNWKDNKVESCRDDTKTKPSNVVGWIPCAIGQNPSSVLCSPLTTEFSCKWGQDCYAVTDYEWAKFEKADTDVCDNRPRLVSYDKCTNWGNKDPKSCEKSKNKPKDIKGWIPCMIGVTPTSAAKLAGIGCSPIGKTVDTCKWGQSCFAITKDIPEFDKCPITMTQIMLRLFTGPSELYSDLMTFYTGKYGDKAKTYGMIALVGCILLILLCCSSSCMSIFKKK